MDGLVSSFRSRGNAGRPRGPSLCTWRTSSPSRDATPPGTYRQRGTSSLQRFFRTHFPELTARFEEFAKRLGRFRFDRISKAVEAFLECGDYTRGLARITCTNPECTAEYFRPLG